MSSSGAALEEVTVDEELFLEDVDDDIDEEEEGTTNGGSADPVPVGVASAEETIAVDESLFDVDDLNLDDPTILETAGDES